MNNGMNSVSVEKPRIDDFHAEHGQSLALSWDHNLRVTVISTNWEGTQAALRLAGKLVKDLGARITLLAVHEVPFHFPLEKPPVSMGFLERNQTCLVYESEVHADEVSVEVVLCRNRKECLKRSLKPHSLVIVGGKRRRWMNKARELKQWLESLGHQAVYASVERWRATGFISCCRALVPVMHRCSNRSERRVTISKENLTHRSTL